MLDRNKQSISFLLLFNLLSLSFGQESVSILSQEEPSQISAINYKHPGSPSSKNKGITSLAYSLTLRNTYDKIVTENITENNCDILYKYDTTNDTEYLLYKIRLDKIFTQKFLAPGISLYCFKSNERCSKKLEVKGMYITDKLQSNTVVTRISKNKMVRAMQNIPLKNKNVQEINIIIPRLFFHK